MGSSWGCLEVLGWRCLWDHLRQGSGGRSVTQERAEGSVMSNRRHRPTTSHGAYRLVRESDSCPAIIQINLKWQSAKKETEVSGPWPRQESECQLLREVTLGLWSDAWKGGAGRVVQAMRTACSKALWLEGTKLVSGSERKPVRLG